MKTISIIAQKGGTGKTTTAQAAAAGIASRGWRVLLIDADAQGNLTYAMGAEPGRGAYELLEAGAIPAGAIHLIGELDFIAASPALAYADLMIKDTSGMKRALEGLNYDYCIIDTPPALGMITLNALTASASAVIVAQADIFSLQGIGALKVTIDTIRQTTNPALDIDGILITRYNPQTIIGRDMRDLIKDTAAVFNTRVYEAYIRENTAVKEAQAMQTDIYSYNPRCNAAADYTAFINELIIEREAHHE